MSRIATRVKELRVAVMFLTRLPVGRVAEPVPGLDQVRWAYPLVGLPVGFVGCMIHAGALGLGASYFLAAGLTLAALVLMTGALHHDGLADLADGLGGGQTPERCLEIMRDSRIGSYGVSALIVVLSIWGAALTQLGDRAGLWVFLTMAVASRFLMLRYPRFGGRCGADAGSEFWLFGTCRRLGSAGRDFVGSGYRLAGNAADQWANRGCAGRGSGGV